MNPLEQIKEEVIKEFGYESFEQFDDKSTFSYDHRTPKIIDEIAIRFATKAINDYLKAVKEKEYIDSKLKTT